MVIEDTFALLDALEQDAEELRETKPRICLEVGYMPQCQSEVLLHSLEIYEGQVLDASPVLLEPSLGSHVVSLDFMLQIFILLKPDVQFILRPTSTPTLRLAPFKRVVKTRCLKPCFS